MKMDPITFSQVYTNFEGDEYTHRHEYAFPHKSGDMERVIERKVILEPHRCENPDSHQPYSVFVKIVDSGIKKDQRIDALIYYDNFYENIFTNEQILLIGALFRGNIQGDEAEKVINVLYAHLIYNASFVEKYLPSVYEYFFNIREESKMSKPMYEYKNDEGIFLGRYKDLGKDYDLYIQIPRDNSLTPSLLAIHGNGEDEFESCLVVTNTDTQALHVAKIRAQSKRLIPYRFKV